MSLLRKLTEHLNDDFKSESDDPVAAALERALDDTSPSEAGVPWEKSTPRVEKKSIGDLEKELTDKLLGKG